LILEVDFLTEYISMILITTKIVEKLIKIAIFAEIEASPPLYEENNTIVESITATVVKLRMMTRDVFLVSSKVANLSILSVILRRNRELVRNYYIDKIVDLRLLQDIGIKFRISE